MIYLPLVGEGGHGCVRQVGEADNAFAQKTYKSSREARGVTRYVLREIATLESMAPHFHVVASVCVDPGPTLVMPLARGTLVDFCGASESTAVLFLTHILSGVEHMHACSFCHRDLKPSNILIFGSALHPTAVVGDCGAARLSIDGRCFTMESPCTLQYRSFESLVQVPGQNGRAADVWSIGLIGLELVTGRIACCGTTEQAQLGGYFRLLGTPTEKDVPSLRTLPGYSSEWPMHPAQDVAYLVKDKMLRHVIRRALDFNWHSRPVCGALRMRFLPSVKKASRCDPRRMDFLRRHDDPERLVYVDWGLELAHNLRLCSTARHLAVRLFDIVLESLSSAQMLHMASCLWIASKAEDKVELSAENVCVGCDYMVTPGDLIRVEGEVLAYAGYSWWSATAAHLIPSLSITPAVDFYADVSLFAPLCASPILDMRRILKAAEEKRSNAGTVDLGSRRLRDLGKDERLMGVRRAHCFYVVENIVV